MTTNRISRPSLGIILILIQGVVLVIPLLQADPPAPESAKTDAHGDPLPPQALARLGSTRWRHADRIAYVAYAAKGKEFVTLATDGTICVREVGTGKELRRCGTREVITRRDGDLFVSGPDQLVEQIRPVALSADGTVAAVATSKDDVRLWDVTTAKELQVVKPAHKHGLGNLALSPDGKVLLTGGREHGAVILWDTATGKSLLRLEEEPKDDHDNANSPRGVVFSSDGKLVAVTFVEFNEKKAENSPFYVKIFDVATGKQTRRIANKGGDDGGAGTHGLAFSADGAKLAWSTPDGTLKVFDTKTGKVLRRIGRVDAPQRTCGLAFSPDSSLLARLDEDQSVELYNATSGKKVQDLGKRKPAREVLAPLEHVLDEQETQCVAFSLDGKTLAHVWHDNTVRFWDVATGKSEPLPPGHSGSVRMMTLTPDGKTVLTGATDGTVRFWDPLSGKEQRLIRVPGDRPLVGVSPSGRLIAHQGGPGEFILRDAVTEKELHKIKHDTPEEAPDLEGTMIRFAPDERFLALSDPVDQTVRVIEVKAGKQLRVLEPFTADEKNENVDLIDHAFAPDGTTLATLTVREVPMPAPVDGKPLPQPKTTTRLRLWDVTTGDILREWSFDGMGLPVIFAPDGRSLAVATLEHVLVFETATGKERCRWKIVAQALAFTPDGSVLVAAEDCTPVFWDLFAGKELGRLPGHTAGINNLAFAKAGRTLISAGDDGTGLVWDVKKFSPVVRNVTLSKDRIESLWRDLGGEAGKAFSAAGELRSSKEAVAWMSDQLKPGDGPDQKQIEKWITALDDEDFDVRKKAATELGKLGEQAGPALRKAREGKPSPEVSRQIDELLSKLKPGQELAGQDLRAVRGVELLERMGTPEARQVLEGLAKGPPGARLTREAQSAVDRLAKR
jgi:WD40 repeat protein